jgi:methyl-accepting chemotaxis protein
MTNVSLASRNLSNGIQKLAGSIDLAELMQVLGIDESLKQQGRQLVEILEEHGEAIFSEFYERIIHISWAHKFRDGEVEVLKQKQFAHWRTLFSGRLDVQYVRNATMVGAVHRQRGIEPLLYIIGYGIIKSALLERIAKKEIPSVDKGRLMVALERYISLDVGLAMVGYSGHKVFAQLFAPGFSA